MNRQRDAWLYCTHGGDFVYLGPLEDEGSFERLISLHVEVYDEEHRRTIHILVDGTPECDEARRLCENGNDFPEYLGYYKRLTEVPA